MNTVLTRQPVVAARFIVEGGVVAFPTETVYGLGANVFDAAAVGRIFEAKMRPADNPLIAHVAEVEQIPLLAREITASAHAFIDAFFPSPLTLVLPKTPEVPTNATAGLDTIGVRMPRSPFAREFLKACGTPVVAPSANLSGRPSPTSWEAVFEDLDGRVECILQGDATEIGLESTVVDCTGEVPLLLRAGAVSLEELQRVVPATVRYVPGANETVKSPGLRHRHYSPRAKVLIADYGMTIEDCGNAGWIGISRRPRTTSRRPASAPTRPGTRTNFSRSSATATTPELKGFTASPSPKPASARRSWTGCGERLSDPGATRTCVHAPAAVTPRDASPAV